MKRIVKHRQARQRQIDLARLKSMQRYTDEESRRSLHQNLEELIREDRITTYIRDDGKVAFVLKQIPEKN